MDKLKGCSKQDKFAESLSARKLLNTALRIDGDDEFEGRMRGGDALFDSHQRVKD